MGRCFRFETTRPEPPELYIRRFRVDTNVFLANLRQETGLALNATNTEILNALLRCSKRKVSTLIRLRIQEKPFSSMAAKGQS